MKRVMFVCHGNICRSPMAEFIFKKIANDAGLADAFLVRSSATSTEEIWQGVGNPIYPPAARELSKNGIPYDRREATLLLAEDYGKYDMFIGMDSANIRNMHRIFGSDPEGKISKLMSYTGTGADVSDPWYTERFDRAYADIYAGCAALFEKLTQNGE